MVRQIRNVELLHSCNGKKTLYTSREKTGKCDRRWNNSPKSVTGNQVPAMKRISMMNFGTE